MPGMPLGRGLEVSCQAEECPLAALSADDLNADGQSFYETTRNAHGRQSKIVAEESVIRRDGLSASSLGSFDGRSHIGGGGEQQKIAAPLEESLVGRPAIVFLRGGLEGSLLERDLRRLRFVSQCAELFNRGLEHLPYRCAGLEVLDNT